MLDDVDDVGADVGGNDDDEDDDYDEEGSRCGIGEEGRMREE